MSRQRLSVFSLNCSYISLKMVDPTVVIGHAIKILQPWRLSDSEVIQ